MVSLTVLAVLSGATAVLLARDPVIAANQDQHGPVLLVPGYGGSTSALEALATSLEAEGRKTVIVRSPGDGTDDLRKHAEALAAAATNALDEGAPSVDVIGYSAGGVVMRYWVTELGGDAQARRVLSLASPQHGTELAAFASELAANVCPTACRQLAPDSKLLRSLNAGDETPAGPLWVAIWTEDDATVTPPSSGALDGALSYSVQSVCPALEVSHGGIAREERVQEMIGLALSETAPAVPSSDVC